MSANQPEPTARDREAAREVVESYVADAGPLLLVNVVAAALATVRAEERERAAALCDHEANHPSNLWEEAGCWAHAAENCAAAIRRGGEPS